MKPTLIHLFVCLIPLFLVSSPPSMGQEEDFPRYGDLEQRAEEVTLRFPWLVQTYSGLSVTAESISREEFLRGLTAATDLVFEGTEELPLLVTLVGRYRGVSALLDAFCRNHPEIDCDIDAPGRMARFSAGPDDGAGLSDIALIARYRRAPIDPALVRRNYGMFFSGALVVDGSIIPSPLEFQIEPMPTENRVILKVNGYPVTEVVHLDVAAIERSLYEATNLEQFKSALQSKLDYSWRMMIRIPFGTERDALNLFARQAAFNYGVTRAEPTRGGIRVHLAAGSHLDWAIPEPNLSTAYDSTEAYAMVQGIQSQVIGGLSLGAMVFMSNRYGVRVFHQPFDFNTRLNALAAEPIDLREKERKIRMEWREEAEWILEYFYTSLISDSWMTASPAPIPTPNPTPSVDAGSPSIPPSMDIDPGTHALIESYLEELEGGGADPLPPDPVARELLPGERGLLSPPASAIEDLPDETEIVPFEVEIEVDEETPEEEVHELDSQSEIDR